MHPMHERSMGTVLHILPATLDKPTTYAERSSFGNSDLGSALAMSKQLRRRCLGLLPALLLAALALLPSSVQANAGSGQTIISALSKHSLRAVTPLLDVFQIYPPVLTIGPGGLELTDGSGGTAVDVPTTNSSCESTLVTHSFVNSYGQPFVGSYNPPPCTFNRITWNLTVTSAGRQYDRLGMVFMGDTEVFRTSTAEPTSSGIIYTYLKDMTNYLSLFREPQTLIFELDNIVNDIYTASFNVTLTASFFTAPDSITPADDILPISARQGSANASSVFTVPGDVASNDLVLPRNTKRAVFTVAATGQSEEEFWWSNVPSSVTDTFPQTGEFYGYSPFREIQLYIDDMLAGVAWPFPIIFTGGVVPGFWRPIVGLDAFDLREDEIDITPWLPVLCDGVSHNFTIRVSGLVETGNGSVVLSETTESYWLVTGKVFIWLDTANQTTTGTMTLQHTPEPSFQLSHRVGTNKNGTVNETLVYQVSASRDLHFASTLHTSEGSKQVTWQQSLSYSNVGNVTDAGNTQSNTQLTAGSDSSGARYSRNYTYPLYVVDAYTTYADNYTIQANMSRGKDVDIIGSPVFPTGLESFSAAQELLSEHPSWQGSHLSTTQNGSATYVANSTSSTSSGFGTTEQDMSFSGVRLAADGNSEMELFRRHAKAVNSTVVEDDTSLLGTASSHSYPELDSTHEFAAPGGVNALLGRGPKGDL